MEATTSHLGDFSSPFVKKNRVQGVSSETTRMEINIVEPSSRLLYNYGRHVWKILKNCIQVAIQILLFQKDPPGTIKITIRDEKGYIQEIFKCSREKLETNTYFKGLINTPMQGAKKVRRDCLDLCDPNPSALAFFMTHLGAPIGTSFDSSKVLHFLAVADFYQDSKLKEACEEILVNGLDGANYQDLYSLAQTYDLKKLKPLCREKILIEQTVAKYLCNFAKHKKKSKVINALGDLGLHTKEIVNVLKKAMDEDSLRGEAAVALAKIMEGEIATHLISCFKVELKKFDWQGNREKNLVLFCEALALTHDPAAQDFLLSLSTDATSGCCEAAKKSLIKYANSAKSRFLLKKFDSHLSLEERKAIISKTDSELLHETIATLTNTGIREDLREAAAKKLAEIGSEEAFHVLVDTIDNKSNEREFREKLVGILSDMQGSYKLLAAQHIIYQAIRQFDSVGGDYDYSQAFYSKLEDKFCYDPILRQGFIEAIRLYMNMPKGHEFQALKTCFNKRREGSDPFSRRLPVVLAMTYKDQALPVLVERWGFETAYRIPEKISEGLGIIGSDAAVNFLGNELENKYKDYLVKALGRTKNPLAYTYLTQKLKVVKSEDSEGIMKAMKNLIGAGAFPPEEIKIELLDTLHLIKTTDHIQETARQFLCRFIRGKELAKWMPNENKVLARAEFYARRQLSSIAPDMLTENEIKIVCQYFEKEEFTREYQKYIDFLSNIASCYPEEVARKLTQLLSQANTIKQARYIIKALSAILPDDEKLEVEMEQIVVF